MMRKAKPSAAAFYNDVSTPATSHERCCLLEKKRNPGNGLFAAQDVAPKSQIVFVARPLMIGLETAKLSTHCYYCYKSAGDASHRLDIDKGQNLKTCAGCKSVKFCDKKCQTRAWSEYHRLECKLYRGLHPRLLPTPVRAIIRVLKQHKAGLLPESEWDDLLAMESHFDDSIKAQERWQDLFIMSKGIKSYCGTDHSQETILQLACKLAINSFTLTNPTFDVLGMVLHPAPAWMNHSCNPNVYVRFDVPPLANPDDFPPYGSISVHALRSIAKNEEITVSYIDTTYPFDKRQEELKIRYFFTCNCSWCLTGGQVFSRDKFPSSANATSGVALPATDAQIREAGDQAERLFRGLESRSGLEHMQIDNIKHAMKQLADTGCWLLHRYPSPQLRHHLLLRYIASQKYLDALLQAGVFVRVIHPVLFEHEHHPIRLLQMVTLRNLCGQCLESMQSRGNISHPAYSMLGLLSCVLIDDIHRIMNRGITANGELENLVDEMLRSEKAEPFWSAYQEDPAKAREKVFHQLDDCITTLLREEGVSQNIF